MRSRYPVYVPSRGRYQENRRLTIKALLRDSVPFRVVVVPSEAEFYEPVVGSDRLLVLPGEDYVLLSTRNWIRDHAEAEGHSRHWQLDDNIIEFRRLWKGRRIPCHAGAALRVCEDLTDRFLRVGVSGLNYQMFVPADTPVPYYRNVHVYSCTLINHEMPYRWRMVYNDDTDLCLQALVGGWRTILLNAFMANKMRTMAIKGGNTNQLYAIDADGAAAGEGGGDTATFGRFEMARALERAWPGLVKTRWRFGRPQHSVDWGKFSRPRPDGSDPLPLEVRPDLDLSALPPTDEYGLVLRAVKPVKAPRLRALLEG